MKEQFLYTVPQLIDNKCPLDTKLATVYYSTKHMENETLKLQELRVFIYNRDI